VVFQPYYPHYQLSRALLCSGDAEGAMEQLEASESQGAMKGGELGSLRSQIETKLAASKTPTPAPTPDPKALAQRALDQLAGCGMILDDQDAHPQAVYKGRRPVRQVPFGVR